MNTHQKAKRVLNRAFEYLRPRMEGGAYPYTRPNAEALAGRIMVDAMLRQLWAERGREFAPITVYDRAQTAPKPIC